MYRNIMIPLDGSRFAEAAIPLGKAVARRSGGELHLFRVHEPLGSRVIGLAGISGTREAWDDRATSSELEYLERVAAPLRAEGLQVRAEQERGTPGEALASRTREGIDLVVMATHGRSGIQNVLDGSPSDAVMRRARVPVILVKAQETLEATEPEIRNVLAASDGSRAGEAAVDAAVQLARLFGGHLTLVRVVRPPAGPTSTYIPHAADLDMLALARREDEAEAYLAAAADQIDSLVPLETRRVRADHPAQGILGVAEEISAELVAVGTHRASLMVRAVLGSVAGQVVRRARCPVLVAHAPR